MKRILYCFIVGLVLFNLSACKELEDLKLEDTEKVTEPTMSPSDGTMHEGGDTHDHGHGEAWRSHRRYPGAFFPVPAVKIRLL